MKKLTLTTLASACTLVLTACGGGGGSSVATPTVQTISVPSSTTSSNTTTTTTTSAVATTSDTSANSSKATTSASSDTSKTTKTTTTDTTNKVTTGSVSAAFAKTGFNKMQTYATYNTRVESSDEYKEYKKLYDGIHIKIDNNTGKATAQETVQEDFQDFTFDGVHMVFLARQDDATKDIPVRKIVEKDFPSGGYNPYNASNPGYMGSYYSPLNTQRDLGPFGRLRFGVYTDGNNISHLFVHGTPATRAFSGTYKGSAIMGKNGDYKAYPRALTAVVNSDVDKIDISLKTDKTTLKFGGAVNSQLLTFEGTKNGISTRGGFFGHDLGGVFEVAEGVHAGENGVFGAADTTTDKDFAATFK